MSVVILHLRPVEPVETRKDADRAVVRRTESSVVSTVVVVVVGYFQHRRLMDDRKVM